MQRFKKEQLSVLMGYDHIAVSALLRIGNNGKNMEKFSAGDAESEEDKISDLEVENRSGGENVNGDDEAFLADELLAPVIYKQGGRVVSYVFQKFD